MMCETQWAMPISISFACGGGAVSAVDSPGVIRSPVVLCSRLAALICDEKELRTRGRLELTWPGLAAQVIADLQRVAVVLIDRQDRLPLVRPLAAGDVELLGIRCRVEL